MRLLVLAGLAAMQLFGAADGELDLKDLLILGTVSAWQRVDRPAGVGARPAAFPRVSSLEPAASARVAVTARGAELVEGAAFRGELLAQRAALLDGVGAVDRVLVAEEVCAGVPHAGVRVAAWRPGGRRCGTAGTAAPGAALGGAVGLVLERAARRRRQRRQRRLRLAGSREDRRRGIEHPAVVSVKHHPHRLGADPIGSEPRLRGV